MAAMLAIDLNLPVVSVQQEGLQQPVKAMINCSKALAQSTTLFIPFVDGY
jgi:hypothetical protein